MRSGRRETHAVRQSNSVSNNMNIMDPAERAVLVEKLRASQDALVAGLAGISEFQAKFKPNPDSWSIEDIVEHLGLAEHGLYRLMTAYSEPLDSAWDSRREEPFEKLGTDRRRKVSAPERVRPTGRYDSLANALSQFLANRDRNILYIERCQEDLRMRTTKHPLGPITCRECVALMIGHPLQHLEQIKEIQTQPQYPSSGEAA
jgi:hypothetical protein